jgi:histidinol phosphatase-like PHP family hydrolase
MMAKQIGAPLVFNTDAHSPSDLVTEEEARKVIVGAGLTADDFYIMQQNALDFVKKVLKERK